MKKTSRNTEDRYFRMWTITIQTVNWILARKVPTQMDSILNRTHSHMGLLCKMIRCQWEKTPETVHAEIVSKKLGEAKLVAISMEILDTITILQAKIQMVNIQEDRPRLWIKITKTCHLVDHKANLGDAKPSPKLLLVLSRTKWSSEIIHRVQITGNHWLQFHLQQITLLSVVNK